MNIDVSGLAKEIDSRIVEIKYDKRTLPEDGQKVEWETDDRTERGTYIASEEMFAVGFEDESTQQDFVREVNFWRPLESEDIPNLKSTCPELRYISETGKSTTFYYRNVSGPDVEGYNTSHTKKYVNWLESNLQKSWISNMGDGIK